MSEQPVFDPQPEQPQPEQPQAVPQQDAGDQVPAGTQVSASVDAPRISQDVHGNPVNISLDPETGAPMEEGSAQ